MTFAELIAADGKIVFSCNCGGGVRLLAMPVESSICEDEDSRLRRGRSLAFEEAISEDSRSSGEALVEGRLPSLDLPDPKQMDSSAALPINRA
jgi:hypothetical protein